MAKRTAAKDIVKWAEKQAEPRNRPAYDRLTQTDLGLLLKYKREGKTQVEIAQRLGCTQGTVSKWLDKLVDTKEPAREYLAGAALRMAQNIVHRGMARDHVQVLNGLNVLNQQDTGKVSITINGLMLAGLGPQPRTFACSTQQVSPDQGQLTDDTGSDNS